MAASSLTKTATKNRVMMKSSFLLITAKRDTSWTTYVSLTFRHNDKKRVQIHFLLSGIAR